MWQRPTLLSWPSVRLEGARFLADKGIFLTPATADIGAFICRIYSHDGASFASVLESHPIRWGGAEVIAQLRERWVRRWLRLTADRPMW